MTATEPLRRRIEEASLNSWPALHQVLLDGWVLRFTRGYTKRGNSVTPLYPSSQPLVGKVRYCESLYARERLKSIFHLRATPEHEALDHYLRQRGYGRSDPSLVLTAMLKPLALSPRWTILPPREWLQHYADLTGVAEQFSRLHGSILGAIRTECAHAVIRDGKRTLACGLGVVERDLLGLFDVITHPECRRQGFAEELLQSALHWGWVQGASTAYLQVAQDNEAARALYPKLGFQEQYASWYRIAL